MNACRVAVWLLVVLPGVDALGHGGESTKFAGAARTATMVFAAEKSPTATGDKSKQPVEKDKKKWAFVASKKSGVFHRPECGEVKKILPQNFMGFATREEATKAGKRPCKKCGP